MCKLLSNPVYIKFTMKEFEEGCAILIRASLNRDNFTDLGQLLDLIGSRPCKTLRQKNDRLAAIRLVRNIQQ